jgi:chromosome segregation ATPase
MEEQSSIRDTLKDEFDLVLNGSQIEDLQKRLQDTEADFKSTQLKLDVVRSSLKYLEAIGDGTLHQVCPTCEGGIVFGEVKSQLEGSEISGDYETNEILEQRDQLRERISAARQLVAQIEEVDAEIAQSKKDLGKTIEQANQAYDLPSPVSMESLGKYVEEVRKDHQNLRNALDSQSEALKSWEVRINNARREVRFHQLRALKERLQRLYDVRYDALHGSLKDLGRASGHSGRNSESP